MDAVLCLEPLEADLDGEAPVRLAVEPSSELARLLAREADRDGQEAQVLLVSLHPPHELPAKAPELADAPLDLRLGAGRYALRHPRGDRAGAALVALERGARAVALRRGFG